MRRRVVPSLLRLGKRVVAGIFKPSVPEEVDEEFAFHVEMRVRELLRGGLALEEARAEAVKRFGRMEEVKAACRRIAWERERKMTRIMWWDDLRQDVGFAFRQIRRRPGFALVATLTLALGIGANTAMFSVVHGVVLRPLPYPEPDRLVMIWTRYLPESGFDIPQFPISPPELLDYRRQNQVMESVGYHTRGSRTLTGPESEAERLTVSLVDDRVFPTLGVEPTLGRWIRPEEDLPGQRVVVLSHDLWVTRFGGDSSVVGRTIDLNGTPSPVVGVMPPEFTFPSEGVDLWENFGLDEADPGNRGSHFLVGIARLKDGESLDRARAEVEGIRAGWAGEYPHNVAHFPILHRLEDDVVGASVRRTLYLLLAAVVLVLLVACVNVANLYLARAEARQPEVAVRAALGAGGGRIARQFLTESLVLAALGGLLGAAAAPWIVRAILSVNPDALPRTAGIAVSAPVLGFTALVVMGTTVLFGIAPAFQAAGRSRAPAPGAGDRATGDRGRRRFRRLLVATEVALSVVVLAGAGLVLRSFRELTRVDAGVRTEGLLTFDVSPPPEAYPEASDVAAFYRRLTARLEALPGVTSVTAGSLLPLTGSGAREDFRIEGRTLPAQGELAWNAQTMAVRPGYFASLGIPLVRGRPFTTEDGPEGPAVTIVSEELVRLFFPGQDPVGQRIGYPVGPDSMAWMRVVGVVGDVHSSLDEDPLPQLYRVQDQLPLLFGSSGRRQMTMIVRTSVEPGSLTAPARAAAAEIDPRIPLARVRTMKDVVSRSVARPRLTRNLLGAFGMLALLLAGVGIYGVVSYSVVRRTREIGIRMALGAGRVRVSALMLREGVGSAFVGALVGVLGALSAGGWLQDLLFQVSPHDPLTLTVIPLILLGTATLASWIPARRASRVAPTVALREE